MYRRTVLSGLAVGTGLLAGCIGDLSSFADESDDDDGDANTAEDRSGDGSDGGTGSTDDLESGAWNAFAFDRPARYEYDFYSADDGDGRLVWDVREIDEDEVTVHVEYESGTDTFESTITGDRDTVQSQLLFTPAGGIVFAIAFGPMLGGFEQETLEVGNEWSYNSPEGSARYAVTGTDSYAGVPCYRTVVESDDEPVHEGCVSPDLGLSVYSAYYDEDGNREIEIELVGYQEG